MMGTDNSSDMEDFSMMSNTTDTTVRYLNIWLLEPGDALAMWAPPNGTTPTSYTAEISYDGNQWRALSLEEAGSTFVKFPVVEQAQFWIRVTPEGGATATEPWNSQAGN
jgi:hypothetical protein